MSRVAFAVLESRERPSCSLPTLRTEMSCALTWTASQQTCPKCPWCSLELQGTAKGLGIFFTKSHSVLVSFSCLPRVPAGQLMTLTGNAGTVRSD